MNSKEILNRLMSSFGKTLGEHSLSIMNQMGSDSGVASMRLNWKCDVYPEIEFDDYDDLWVKVQNCCLDAGVNFEYGDWRVTYEFIYLDSGEKYDDNIIEDEMVGSFGIECHGFEVGELLYDIHDDEEWLVNCNLSVNILNLEKI